MDIFSDVLSCIFLIAPPHPCAYISIRYNKSAKKEKTPKINLFSLHPFKEEQRKFSAILHLTTLLF